MSGRGNRVDVIIPTRNRAQLTAEAIEGVKAQTFTDWHLYVVDDASDDDTASSLEESAVGDPRITVLRRTRQAGGNPARQTALEASGAPLVALCDSDDLWEPRKLERQVAHWDGLRATSDDVGIVTCWHQPVDSHGEPIGPVLRPGSGRRWHPFTLFNTSTPLISRSIVEAAGGFAASPRYPLPTSDHVELFLRLTSKCEISTVPEMLVRCRHHGSPRNSDAERTVEAAVEAELLARDFDALLAERPEMRAWTHAWVAGRYLELGRPGSAKPFIATALRAAGPALGARIAAHYGPWALRELVRQRRSA